MNNAAKIWMGVAILLFIVIIAMATMLFTLPGKEPVVETATTTQQQVPSQTQHQTPPPVQSTKPAVSSPLPNTAVGSTFTVKGKAPGPWFFEATFPMQVRDKDNNVIGHGHANAQGDWQTTGIVAFEGVVQLDSPYSGEAVLVLMKDNPSGLPENDDSIEIPISIQ